jgi:hypothetical protein
VPARDGLQAMDVAAEPAHLNVPAVGGKRVDVASKRRLDGRRHEPGPRDLGERHPAVDTRAELHEPRPVGGELVLDLGDALDSEVAHEVQGLAHSGRRRRNRPLPHGGAAAEGEERERLAGREGHHPAAAEHGRHTERRPGHERLRQWKEALVPGERGHRPLGLRAAIHNHVAKLPHGPTDGLERAPRLDDAREPEVDGGGHHRGGVVAGDGLGHAEAVASRCRDPGVLVEEDLGRPPVAGQDVRVGNR